MKRIERKLHKMIEEEGREETARAWARLEARLNEMPQYNTPKQSKKRLSPKLKKILVSCASVAVVVAAGLGFSLGFGLQKPIDDNRYCSVGDYSKENVDLTLKQYSEANENKILYIDWYNELEDNYSIQFKLKENNEVICFQENITDVNYNYITISVTDNKTELDIFNKVDFNLNEKNFNEIKISYLVIKNYSYANFEYNNFKYFIELQIDDSDYLFNIVEQLLQSANG